MYSTAQRKAVLRLYKKTGNASAVINQLGFPGSAKTLYRWRDAHSLLPRKRNVYLTSHEKLQLIDKVQSGQRVKDVAAAYDVTGQTAYNILRSYSCGNEEEPVNPPKRVKPDDLPDDIDELKKRCQDLQFENDLMREVVELVKKDQGVNLESLENKEKTIMIDALRPMYSLTYLVNRFEISPSSYHYAHNVLSRPDKYADVRKAITEIFTAAGRARGYRYVTQRIKERADIIAVNEKKIRAIMSEEGLRVVYLKKKKRRYSSYQGEISIAPENLVKRDFHAGSPNELWLTDITEFKLPDDVRKVYLSPVLDCFDGGLVSWSIGLSPNAELANTSLVKACTKLRKGQRPVCHSDRGCHYRWPGWIDICKRNAVTRSMSKKGCSPDNSACEGLFGRMKNEFFYYRDWTGVSAEEFTERLDKWLRYYNDERIKESLGWLSPMQYRKSLGLAA